MWTAGVLELSSDPAEGLLGQRFHIIIASVLNQLRQRRRQKLGAASIRIGFESVPVTITDADVLMQSQNLLNRLFWPFLRGHVGVESAGSPYPDPCDCWWW